MYESLVANLRNCAETNSLSRYKRELMKQAADAIEELSKLYINERIAAVEPTGKLAKMPFWIPVTERLPKNDDFVIVTVLDERGDTPYKYSDFGWYLEVAKVWIVDTEQRTDITHWMPLPEPPKDGE